MNHNLKSFGEQFKTLVKRYKVSLQVGNDGYSDIIKITDHETGEYVGMDLDFKGDIVIFNFKDAKEFLK